MNSTPTSDDAASNFARQLDAFFVPLAVLLVARFRLLGHWAVPLLTRLNRAHRRLAKLLARLAEGRIPTCRASSSHPRASRGGPPPIRLPGRRFWLILLLRHEAAVYRVRLEAALNDPATAALLAANPAAARSIARTLSPFCQLLGVTNPHAPPRTPRRRRPRSRIAAIPAAQKPPTPKASRARAPALTTDGYMIHPPSRPPSWPPLPRLATPPPPPPPPPRRR